MDLRALGYPIPAFVEVAVGRRRDESDEELWGRVARSAKPLATGRAASHADRPKKEPQRETAQGDEPTGLAPKVAPKPPPTARGEA